MFWGVVIMDDAGVVDMVVLEEAVESLVLSFVCCSLLLHDANENNNAPNSTVDIVRTGIIVVVLKINKCRAEEVMQGVMVTKCTIKAE